MISVKAVSYALIPLIVGCSSIQIRYKEDVSRKSVIEEYKVIKKTKKSWDVTKNKSFSIFRSWVIDGSRRPENDPKGLLVSLYFTLLVPPAIDIAMFPFQIVYDAFFSYKTEYEERLSVSGCLVDANGQPVPNNKLNLADTAIITDNKGCFRQALIHNYTGEKGNPFEHGSEVSIKINEMNITSLNDDFQKGNRVTQTLPLQIKYFITPQKNAGVVREDFVIGIESHTVGRDSIKTEWVPIMLSSDVIRLTQYDYFSQTNHEITKNEILAEEERKMQQAKEAEMEREQEAKLEEERLRREAMADKKIGHINNFSSYEVMNWHPSDEIVIFSRAQEVGSDMRSLLSNEQDMLFYLPIQVLQVMGPGRLLFALPSRYGSDAFVFVGELANSCVKREYYDGQLVEMVAVTRGTYSYTTVNDVVKTVPKVKMYAIRPYKYQY